MTRRPHLSTLTARRLALAVTGLGAAGWVVLSIIRLQTGGSAGDRVIPDLIFVCWLVILAGLYFASRPTAVRTHARLRRRLRPVSIILVSAIILLAAYLRFHELGSQSMWFDETLTATRAGDPTLQIALTDGELLDIWPPYHIPLYLFARLAGNTEFSLRFLSALAGVLFIPAVFILGRRLFSAWEGTAAALFSAVLRTPIWYSQEARTYALLALLAAVSSYLWFRMAQELYWSGRVRRQWVLGYIIAAILTMYAHYFGMMVVFVQGLGAAAIAIGWRRLPRELLASYAVIGLSYLPWLPNIRAGLKTNVTWVPAPGTALEEFAGFVLHNFHDPGLYGKGGEAYRAILFQSPVAVGVLILLGVGLAAALWRRLRKPAQGMRPPVLLTPSILLGAWLLLTFALAYIRSVVSLPSLVYRYMLIDAAPVYLLFAHAIRVLPLRRLAHTAVGVGLAAVFLYWLVIPGEYYSAPHKVQYRQAIQYIVAHENDYPEPFLISAQIGTPRFLLYYFRMFGSDHGFDMGAGYYWQIKQTNRALDKAQPKTIWFMGEDGRYDKHFFRILASHGELLETHRFYSVTVWIFRVTQTAATSP